MKRARIASLPRLICLAAALAAQAGAQGQAGAVAPAAPASSRSAATAAAAEADALALKAREAIESNHLAEAIRSWIAIVALGEEVGASGLGTRVDAARAELQRVALRLSLEPSAEWLDKAGAQVAAASAELGRPSARVPAVYLFENFGTGKSPVADVPIAFEFIEGGGSLLSPVSTDAWGKANTTVTAIARPGAPVSIRAYPLFRVRGLDWAFRAASRDFSYLPAPRVARVVAMESFTGATVDGALSIDAVAAVLKSRGIGVSPLDGALAPEGFRKALAGDVAALAELGVGEQAPYAILVWVEGAEPRQMVLNGKAYNIFTVEVRVNLRALARDGRLLWSLPIEGIKGQGGSAEAARADARRKARDALGPELEKRADALAEAFDRG